MLCETTYYRLSNQYYLVMVLHFILFFKKKKHCLTYIRFLKYIYILSRGVDSYCHHPQLTITISKGWLLDKENKSNMTI